MTRDEAFKTMQAVKSYMISGNPIWSVTAIGEAFDMAIEALEQPERKKGKWDTALRDDPLIKTSDCICSICGGITFGTPDFCPNCGADMRMDNDDE